jgi:hypothetical protein
MPSKYAAREGYEILEEVEDRGESGAPSRGLAWTGCGTLWPLVASL